MIWYIVRIVLFLVMSYISSTDVLHRQPGVVQSAPGLDVGCDYGGLTEAFGLPTVSFRTLLILVAIGATVWQFRLQIFNQIVKAIQAKYGVDLSQIAPTQEQVDAVKKVALTTEEDAVAIANKVIEILNGFSRSATMLNGGTPVNFRITVEQPPLSSVNPSEVQK